MDIPWWNILEDNVVPEIHSRREPARPQVVNSCASPRTSDNVLLADTVEESASGIPRVSGTIAEDRTFRKFRNLSVVFHRIFKTSFHFYSKGRVKRKLKRKEIEVERARVNVKIIE